MPRFNSSCCSLMFQCRYLKAQAVECIGEVVIIESRHRVSPLRFDQQPCSQLVHVLMRFAQGDEPGKFAQLFRHLAVVPLAEAAFMVGFGAEVVLVARQPAGERADHRCVPLLVVEEGLFQLREYALQLIPGDVVSFHSLSPAYG